MDSLKINAQKVTLVDQVEEKLIDYFKEKGLRPGSPIPNEMELSGALGVARSVLREALSRFKMSGMIETRTKRGMIMAEPSILGGMKRSVNPLLMNESTILDILEFRIVLEIGITGNIMRNITDGHIAELENIVEMGIALGNNKYAPISEYQFHTKLYEITGNKTIMEFQEIIHPVLNFIKDKHKALFEPISEQLVSTGEVVTHHQLLEFIKKRDEEGYLDAIKKHFKLYTIYLASRKNS